jgi:hypothetical protein
MTFMLKRDAAVAADPKTEGYTPNLMVTLKKGAMLKEISAYEKKQLSPEHFVDGVLEDDGSVTLVSDKLPADWRDDDARKRDDLQRRNVAHLLAGEPEEDE